MARVLVTGGTFILPVGAGSLIAARNPPARRKSWTAAAGAANALPLFI